MTQEAAVPARTPEPINDRLVEAVTTEILACHPDLRPDTVRVEVTAGYRRVAARTHFPFPDLLQIFVQRAAVLRLRRTASRVTGTLADHGHARRG